MKHTNNNIDPSLLIRFLSNETDEEENRIIYEWIQASPENRETFLQQKKVWDLTSVEGIDKQIDLNKDLQDVEKRIALTHPGGKSFSWKSLSSRVIKVAAAILILLSIGTFLIYNLSIKKHEVALSDQSIRFKNDVAPGGDKAILTLADGSNIVLDNAINGTLAHQGNTKILKLNDGQLIYNAANHPSSSTKILYNTISTPKGGQYQVVLPDGSKVWLNASSSLKFPTAFKGKTRNVEITGEAYFEVSKFLASRKISEKVPFIVKANGVEVEVLGTHFNIMAYAEEGVIKTTLLEGKVIVKRGKANGLLKPGQEAKLSFNQTSDKIVIKNADIEESVAWKNGRFLFNNADIKTIMRQVMRWYDVEIIYEGAVQDRYFSANISRNTNLTDLLKVFELNKIYFKIDGKKLIVLP